MAKADDIEKQNLNALSIALKKEEDSFAFYKNAEKTVQFKPLKTLFRDLAKEEVKHKSLIVKEMKKLEGGAKNSLATKREPFQVPIQKKSANSSLPIPALSFWMKLVI